MRKLSIFLLLAALIFGATACGTKALAPDKPGQTVTSAKWALSAFNTFSGENPVDEGGTDDALQAGKTADGKDVFAVIRMELGAQWLTDELTDAKLFLKSDGAVPDKLRVNMITGGWDSYFTPRSEMEVLLDKDGAVVSVSAEKNGWISIPLTEQVKIWLGGDLQNNGAAIFGETGALYTFASDEGNAPYILASGAVGDRALTYGKFGYKEMTTVDDDKVIGNCLAYALRDEDPIEDEHLGTDTAELARRYAQGGLDAITDYTAQLATAYIEAHKSGLQISGFRPIDDFDSAIDPTKEYRIALRMGVSAIDGEVDFDDPNAADYHWWLQLNDGQWAQKFPTGASQIVPCTGPGISPGKYPWHSSTFWTPKSRDFYTGKTVCFAVTKVTDDFTRHRQ